MKKIYLLIAILLCRVTLSNAQNVSPYWSLAGNSNATSSSKLGTTNAINLRMFTNNVERMRLATSGLVGINTTAPNARLHVNSSSGQNSLRAQVNGSTKFLVSSNGGVAIGANLTPPTNGLYVLGNVGIGTNVPSYKMHVVTPGTAVFGNSTDPVGTYYGVWGNSTYTGVYGTGTTYGVVGRGIYGVVGSGSSYGVYGGGDTYGVYGTSGTYGVYGQSNGGYGVYGSGGQYGVFGYSPAGNGGRFYSADGYGLYAITGRADNSWAAVFDGNVYCYNAYQGSDKNLKKNITEFKDAMSIINKLKPKNYEFITDGKLAPLNLPRGHHYGLIAQDVEQVLPELVKESVHDLNFVKFKEIRTLSDGKEPTADTRKGPPSGLQKEPELKQTVENITIKAVNYTELIPIMIKGMQEQQAQMQDLNKKNDEKDKLISDLQSQINELKSLITKGATIASSTAFLKQNIPNPANNNTVVSYYIPDNAGHAQIKITDVKGSLIKTFTASKGEGQINIRSDELPAGTYNYTLYINNETIDTRQMVLIK